MPRYETAQFRRTVLSQVKSTLSFELWFLQMLFIARNTVNEDTEQRQQQESQANALIFCVLFHVQLPYILETEKKHTHTPNCEKTENEHRPNYFVSELGKSDVSK